MLRRPPTPLFWYDILCFRLCQAGRGRLLVFLDGVFSPIGGRAWAVGRDCTALATPSRPDCPAGHGSDLTGRSPAERPDRHSARPRAAEEPDRRSGLAAAARPIDPEERYRTPVRCVATPRRAGTAYGREGASAVGGGAGSPGGARPGGLPRGGGSRRRPGGGPKRSTRPEGQRTSTDSTRSASPRPKWSRGSPADW